MKDTTAPAPAPVYTVWSRPRYTESTEVWSGEDFAKAISVALAQVGVDSAHPMDHTNTVALRDAGIPVSAWMVTDGDGDERIVFITR
jgi:hypothetical protein